MFELYTFGAPACQTEDVSCEVSPHETIFPAILPCLPDNSRTPEQEALFRYSGAEADGLDVSDLITRMEKTDCDPFYASPFSLPSPVSDFEDGAVLGQQVSAASRPAPPINPSLRCRRQQRQMNMHLQCTSSQMRNISTLVDDMLSTGAQCNVRKGTPSPPVSPSKLCKLAASPPQSPLRKELLASPPASPFSKQLVPDDEEMEEMFPDVENSDDADEGFCEGDSEDFDPEVELELSLRKAGVPRGIRKHDYNPLSYRGGAAILAQNGSLVRCPPRMRRAVKMRRPARNAE